MTKKKATRRALLMSFVALLLCFTMLLGTTFAWFTDSVSSARNTIKSGNLDVELYYSTLAEDGTWTEYAPVDETTKIFKDGALYEPGYTEVVKFKVVNAGSLAFKYNMNVAINSETDGTNKANETFKLSEYLYIGALESVTDRDAAAAEATVKLGSGFAIKTDAEIKAGDPAHEFAVVLTMPTTVGNEANHINGKQPAIELGIDLVATQLVHESDSFGSDYDEDATYPLVSVGDKKGDALTLTSGDVSVTIPVTAADATYTLQVNSKNVSTDDLDQTTVSYDIVLLKDGVKIENDGTSHTVVLNVGPYLDIVGVTHNTDAITDYVYESGKVIFETTSFSPFAVTYNELGEGLKVVDGKIAAGVFEEINPATLDASLAEADSKYIAVNYVQNGKTYYTVSERATTVVVAADAAEDYVAENGNYTVTTNQSGKLASLISGLQNNKHSTVYLLPGTYNEAPTVYVYSSMDIIGLGDKDTVKVVKGSSSSSNRHLFNCNGTKSDYIEVTIKNLYLDATAKTTNNKDNAAVQSIRKSKVKCYDLTIVKGTGWDAVAFYVNGNNAVDGVKYPAYMYVENCVLNTTRTFGIVTTSGTYTFAHNNLKYNNGNSTYTTNTKTKPNVQMDPSDWEW